MRNQHRDGAVQPKTLRLLDGGAVSPRGPDMNGLQVEEAEKLRREALIWVGDRLRDHYSDLLKEALPNRLTDLLRRLVAPDAGGCEEQDRKWK